MTRVHSVVVLVLLLAGALPAAEQTLGDSGIRFSPDPHWVEQPGKPSATAEAECDLRWNFPPPAGGEQLFHNVHIVLYATYKELTLEEARDSELENIKVNQRLGNPIKLVDSRQVGPAAWWILTDKSRMVLGGMPGDPPVGVHREHFFVYFVLGKKMMIQIFEHSPTGQQPIQHQKTMDEITKLLSSFTDSGTPMFVFAKSKPAKSK